MRARKKQPVKILGMARVSPLEAGASLDAIDAKLVQLQDAGHDYATRQHLHGPDYEHLWQRSQGYLQALRDVRAVLGLD